MHRNLYLTCFIVFIVLCRTNPAFAQTASCEVVQVLHNPTPHVLWSPDSTQYLVNKQDAAGVFQIYIGQAGDTALTCISLTYSWSLLRPWSQRNKMQVQWHHSGDFIICAVEKEFYPELLYVPYNLRLGWLQSGIWMDIWAVKPDGSNWYPLAYTENGFTGPAFTPDGSKGAWAEAHDSSNLFVDVFGVWDLKLSEFVVNAGVPSFANTTSINPAGARWIEPGNFAPDGVSLLISADIGLTNAEGQDQYILNTETGQVTNLTNSPMIWDEHGVFSPDGEKILFMSSYPYRADTNSYHTLSIKTEFMLMNADGSDLQQLTHFRTPGYPEYHEGIAATGFWHPDGSRIYAQSLIFPDYENWIIGFAGNCGNQALTGTDEFATAMGLKLYPNPAQNMLTLETDADLSQASIRIFNAFGQQVKAIRAGNDRPMHIPVDDLERGVYFLRVQSEEKSAGLSFIRN